MPGGHRAAGAGAGYLVCSYARARGPAPFVPVRGRVAAVEPWLVARKPNYDFEKRRKEQERQAKKDAKREERRRREEQSSEDGATPAADEVSNPASGTGETGG